MFTESPVILAPMAGGVGTPELVAAVTEAGGFGFLPAGYLPVDELAARWQRAGELTGGPFGLNLFVPGQEHTEGLVEYVAELGVDSVSLGTELGEPRWEDDDYPAKVELAIALRVPVVSFTFGLPSAGDVDRLHAAGSTVVATVTEPAEAEAAFRIGADVLCAQGAEAGGHRGCFNPAGGEEIGLLPLLGRILESVDLPVIAAGGIMRAADTAAVLAAGAAAAQCGTAFLRCPEAGTNGPYRDALAGSRRPTAFTSAYTGRPARGLVTAFAREHPDAPSAYPQIHHVTQPLRVSATEAGDWEHMSLWAGEGYPLGRAEPAADVLRSLTPAPR